MAGGGTDAAGGPSSARLLDLSRLAARIGRQALTGVDRVELAYLHRLLTEPVPLFGLVRTALGFALLDRGGAAALMARVSGDAVAGPADMAGRIFYRRNPARARVEADLRRVAIARCLPFGLGRMLRRNLPAGTTYLNAGHANLSARVFRAIQSLPGASAVVLIHDVIPLDHPEFTRPGISAVFQRKLAAVSAYADLVICNSAVTRDRTAHHMARMGRVPPMMVAHLGIAMPKPEPAKLPQGLRLDRPWFVVLGTIEPRKNHALLLDVWRQFHATLPEAEIPTLFILGARGWRNEAVAHRLDSEPFMGRTVIEMSGLEDGAVAALLEGAKALLFPSHAEGFGLPMIEAAALGVPIICSPLPVFREILNDYPVYVSETDSYSWVETIGAATKANAHDVSRARQAHKRPNIPTWDDHFNAVLGVI